MIDSYLSPPLPNKGPVLIIPAFSQRFIEIQFHFKIILPKKDTLPDNGCSFWLTQMTIDLLS